MIKTFEAYVLDLDNSNVSTTFKKFFKPKNKKELKQYIEKYIKENGTNCDLNHIDVSEIIDMSNLFLFDKNVDDTIISLNVNISKWDVSNVIDMSFLFRLTDFNNDISEWDVTNVKNMYCMFAYSTFNQDISKWNVSKNTIISSMFKDCNIKKEFKPKFK